jgi:hypothetical protein
MRRIAAALIAAVLALPAAAQVDCGAPITGSDAKFAADYARNVTVPLIDHNAGGLGPVMWAYIAGQARAESLANMQDADGGFIPKPNNNLWNVQTNATKECSHRTIVGCLPSNRHPPYADNKDVALERQCWNETNPMQWVKVCFPSYPTLETAAEDYLTRRPNYTKALKNMGKGDPSREDFFKALKAAFWSDQAAKAAYKNDTLDAIDQVMRGLATLREADKSALAAASGEIDAWCAKSGVGDPSERAALRAKQAALLDSLRSVSKVCTLPAGSAAPKANTAIDTCRNEQDPPPPPAGPPDDQKPAGHASGTGEPHYRLPGGLTLSTQRAGEFWLLDAPDGTRIQVRQVPWGQSRDVAAIGAIAAQIGTQRIGVYADGRVMVGGKALQWTGRFHQRALGSDAVIGVWGPQERPSQAAVMWRNGRTLRIHLRSSWLDIETSWTRGTAVANDRGLIGRASSNAQGALIGRDNRRGQLANSDQADGFVTSWRIQAKESLFDYQAGESVATFDLRGFPEKPAKPTREALEAARAACLAAGVRADRLEACAFDLAVTGSKEFLASHLPALAAASTSPEPKVAPLGTHPTLFTPDIANPVQTLPNGSRFDTSIGAGEQRTYRIDANRGDPPVFLNVISNNLSCVAEEVDGSKPAYQLFDARGRAISKAKPTCADLFTSDVEEGDYYLVIKGAKAGGPMEVSLEAWAN